MTATPSNHEAATPASGGNAPPTIVSDILDATGAPDPMPTPPCLRGQPRARQRRLLHALWIAPVMREQADRIAGASNAPEVVSKLRRNLNLDPHADLICEDVEKVDRDGRIVLPGRYILTDSGRAKVLAACAETDEQFRARKRAEHAIAKAKQNAVSVAYAQERWRDVVEEMMPLWMAHWREVALDNNAVELDPDFGTYAALDHAGMLQVITARHDGKLVGYHVSIIRSHLHYKSTLHAATDIYYIVPAHRLGTNGTRLFAEAERAWRERGVVKAMTGTKVHKNIGAIFKRQGWRETEHTYTKLLAGSQP